MPVKFTIYCYINGTQTVLPGLQQTVLEDVLRHMKGLIVQNARTRKSVYSTFCPMQMERKMKSFTML